MRQISKKEAILFSKNRLYEDFTDKQIVEFQLFQNKLAMPFGVFHEALTNVLKRPVYTHELAKVDDLRKEFLKDKEPPTFQDIVNIIPKEKRLLFSSSE